MAKTTTDPTTGFTVTIRKTVFDKMEKLRGDISRSKYVERAIEAKNAKRERSDEQHTSL